MLRTSMEKMGTYIGTKFGVEAAQEWISGKKIIPPEPAYSQAVLIRHAAIVKVTKDRIELKLKGLRTEKSAILAKIMSAPTDQGVLKEMREVDDNIAKGEIELTNDVDMKLTKEKRKFPIPMHGRLTEKLMRALRRAGEKSTPCYSASAPKYLSTR
jgi:hypothetical protein